MSDAQSHEHDAPHEGPIKTPKQLILAVFFAFVVPILTIVLLVQYVTTDHKPAAGSQAMTEEAIAQRLHPVGSVEVKDLNDPSSLKTGEQVFAAQCSACHATGAVGAPKFGDAAAWGPRVGKGYDALLNSALHGKGNMGPQGGGDFSDLEIGRAVVYMANQGGGKLEEPKAAVVSASAAASAPAADAAPDAAAQQAAAAMASLKAQPEAAAAPAAAAVPALFTQTCQMCHGTGVAGAPKVGDKAAWAPRLAQGVDGLTASAIKGKGAMPPKGGAATASDADIKAVVTYMVSTVK
jgi:cytochrome c5